MSAELIDSTCFVALQSNSKKQRPCDDRERQQQTDRCRRRKCSSDVRNEADRLDRKRLAIVQIPFRTARESKMQGRWLLSVVEQWDESVALRNVEGSFFIDSFSVEENLIKMMKGRGRGKKSSSSDEATTAPIVGRGRGRGEQKSGLSSCEHVTVGQKPSKKHELIKQIAYRPDYGAIGQRIQLITNLKLMELPPSLKIYCYHVNIMKTSEQNKRMIENRDVCREVFWEAISNSAEIFGAGYSLVYDDCHALYSLNKLKTEKPTLELFVERKSALKPIHISFMVLISFTNYFTVNIDEESLDFGRSMMFLNCLVTQRMRCPYMSMASNFYPFEQCIFMKPYEGIPYKILNMGPGMEAWTGLCSAVKRCEKGLMLNMDVSTKVFYKVDMWLVDFYLAVLNEFIGRRKPYDIERVSETFSLSGNQRQQLKDALKGEFRFGLMLKLTYANRHVKFLDIGLPARIQRFELKRGDDFLGEVTVEEYFNRYKNIHLNFPNLPVLHCGNAAKKEYFPMELLRLSDNVQRVKKRLTPFQIAKLIRGTTLSPLERFKKVDWLLKRIKITDNEFLQQFGITFPSVSEAVPESVRISGRILPSPMIKFKKIEIPAMNGCWRLADCFFQTASNVLFAAVFVDEAINIRNFRDPFNTLIRTCKLFGMKFVREDFGSDTVEIYNWNTSREEVDTHVRSFKKVCNAMEKKTLKPLMVFIVAEKNDDTYGQIKMVCDKKEGVASQVIRAETFLKMHGNPEINAVSHNICLKINTKLDGINNEVARSQLYWKKFTDKEAPTLFIGVDVIHPPSGDQSSPSIVAIVGSLNINGTRYAASLKIQKPGLELITHSVEAFRTRIMNFEMQAGCKPQHIVVLRDGVSDSQFMDVINEELLCLKTAIHQLDQLYDPTVSYVIVQKRHHTRFIEQDVKISKDKGNIPPGTVVDSTITSPLRFDFYLCSHRGAIGTSRPSHYTVLYDSWRLSADEWQQMIYALCHVYARCSKSVSIPAPVYYAHLACDRARLLLKYKQIDETVRNKPDIYMLEQSLVLNPGTPDMYFI
uniref:Piwi domain-containing protein n=1 Tax=Setaria digitata TaxID=48799 RepID=A0A915PZK5_9BILA